VKFFDLVPMCRRRRRRGGGGGCGEEEEEGFQANAVN